MLLTTELDKLSGTDWQLFFAQERAKPVLCGAGRLCDGGCGGKNRLPRGGEHLRRVPRLPGVGGAGRHSGAGPLP